jgi:lysophospholipid acyltransferase (LPLAT)-like uncharacterized protein
MEDSVLTAGQRRKAHLIATAAWPLVAALGRTIRWRVEGASNVDDVLKSGRQPIYVCWHGRIFAGMYYFRDRGIVVITSRNFDGEWIAALLGRFGFGTARGSTSRGAARALVQLRRDLNQGRPAAFTVDGPRGPARVAQAGAIWLAGATGHPIVPLHPEAARFWEASSWDRTQIPKPFSPVALVIGEPIVVPDTSEATVEAGRVTLERTLVALEQRARVLVSGADS